MRKKNLSFQSDHTPDEGLINLTPLIDVVFVVLIMFIIIAPLIELDRVNLASGEKKKQKSTLHEKTALTIHVHENNSVWINHELISENYLKVEFRKFYDKNPSQIPKLFHDKRAHFGTYQKVKNAVEAAGFQEMDIILQKEQ